VVRALATAAVAVLAAACAEHGAQVWDPIAGPGAAGSDVGAGPAWPEEAPLPPDFDTPTWLTMPEPGRIVVGWLTPADTTATVTLTRLDDPGAPGASLADAAPGTVHHVDLGVLPAGVPFGYQVTLAGGATWRGAFAIPAPGTPWRLLHQAEFHSPTGSPHVAAYAAAIRAFRPEVAVESGDMLDSGDDAADWLDYLRTSSPWISNVILLPAHSNHVNGELGNPYLLAYFPLPDSGRWYTTRIADLEVVTLDSTFDGPAGDIATQGDWVRDRMASLRGSDPPDLVIAAWHYPACSSHYASRTDQRRWVIDHLVPAFVDSGGLDLLLVGHDKYYERSTLEVGGLAIPQVMENAGKLQPSTAGGNEPECTPLVTDTATYSLGLFEVDRGALTARVIAPDGGLIDQFSVGG
jgi:hypothetical protein